ncbi:alpha-crystallin A chain isoform X1 [Heptranchias perlo]|uniref:alpha-crystallin A chain isoform X1 n=1 Tax=Heptranchias perlo TaxID=212740 RepID=UPI00355A8A6E
MNVHEGARWPHRDGRARGSTLASPGWTCTREHAGLTGMDVHEGARWPHRDGRARGSTLASPGWTCTREHAGLTGMDVHEGARWPHRDGRARGSTSASPGWTRTREHVGLTGMDAHEGARRPQVRYEKDRFLINLNVKHFSPDELSVKIIDDFVEIHGKHAERQEDHGRVSREFHRTYRLPSNVDQSSLSCSLSPEGMLTLCGPKNPSGADSNWQNQPIPVTHEEKLGSQPVISADP